jgi:hypothetical protein
MKKIYSLIFLLALFCSVNVMSIENYPADHVHDHQQVKDKNYNQSHLKYNIKTYSCDLRSYSNQCREYSILEGAKDTFEELDEGCESMSGTFKQTICPSDEILTTCMDIVRNYHKPDVIYDNYYYQGNPSAWTKKTVMRVCGDLGGELE